MESQISATASAVRPYFLPGVDFENLPQPVQQAFDEIVGPAYAELVLGAATPLERSAGVSVVFLLALEVMDHFGLGAEMAPSELRSADTAVARQRTIAQHLRVVGAKQQAVSALSRLKALRAKQDPFQGPSA